MSEKVKCHFCGNLVQNDKGWPVCRMCYETGLYLKWLQAELRANPEDSPYREELVRAITTCYGSHKLVS